MTLLTSWGDRDVGPGNGPAKAVSDGFAREGASGKTPAGAAGLLLRRCLRPVFAGESLRLKPS